VSSQWPAVTTLRDRLVKIGAKIVRRGILAKPALSHPPRGHSRGQGHRHPGFPAEVRRTLERRVQLWQSLPGPEHEVSV
jgi:hypothetical protein